MASSSRLSYPDLPHDVCCPFTCRCLDAYFALRQCIDMSTDACTAFPIMRTAVVMTVRL